MRTAWITFFCLGALAPFLYAQEARHDIRPGPGVTSVKRLSDYLPALAKTPGDTTVYILEGKQRGGTVFVAGGTHGNEIAGIMAAIVLVERARVEMGRLILIPHANNSAVSYVDPKRPGPSSVTIETAGGSRKFLIGSRLTRPEHQGVPDPPNYRHPKSNEALEGTEARNLDRAYPGNAQGNLTEKIAYAIVQLLRQESVDIAFDLHESGPDSRLAWMIVANPKNIETAAIAVLSLDAAGIQMKLEPSAESFRGLSHREWGDATKAQAFLFETPNPGMGESQTAVNQISDPRFPLAKRVGVQLATFQAVLDAYAENATAERLIKLLNIPEFPEMLRSGVGTYLK
jgi:predicted deacylase